MEWFLKHNCNLKHVLRQNYFLQASGPWSMGFTGCQLQCLSWSYFPNRIKQAPVEEKYEWDSDNDNVLSNEDRAERHHCVMIRILGFHPFKEVIFLCQSLNRGLAYHWNSSKVQDLGNMDPTEYKYFADIWPDIDFSFPYTPSWSWGLTEAAYVRRAQG